MSNIQRWRFAYNWISQFCDPRKVFYSMKNLRWYFSQLRKYRSLPASEEIRLIDMQPQLHDRIPKTPFDSHYFWSSGWATRKIVSSNPSLHLDVGSHNMFVNMLSAVIPVLFIDYRPLNVRIPGLIPFSADILRLPFKDQSIESLSCLHVAEHIGLGRYGDSLNPAGTRQACEELERVLAPGGSLYFALPVGKSRLCFNAHRIHAPVTIVKYFSNLELLEFSGVDDNGQFVRNVALDEFNKSSYACGMFQFKVL